MACEQPAFLDPTGRLVDPAPAEIATSAGLVHRCRRRPAGPGPGAVHRPARCAGWPAGRPAGSAQGPGDRLWDLRTGPGRSGAAGRAAVGYAAGHTRAQLRAWLARRVAAIDPAAVQRRRKQAVRARRVWITPDTDGMATLGAYLSAEEAQACWNALVAGAANIEGGHGRGPRRHARGPADRAGPGPAGPGAGADHPRPARNWPATARSAPATPRNCASTPPASTCTAPPRPAATGPRPGWPAGYAPATGTAASPAAAGPPSCATWTT